MIDIDKEFGNAIFSIGGERVDAMPGYNRAIPNADYIFREEKVVAELKNLAVDQITSERAKKRCSEIYERAVTRGIVPPLQEGAHRISSGGLPAELVLELRQVYLDPIMRIFRTADEQIGATKAHFKLDDHRGLLLLANSGHTAMHPANARDLIGEALRSKKFANFRNVVFFTPNMLVSVSSQKVFIWAPMSVQGGPQVQPEFLKKLSECWVSHHKKLLGKDLPIIEAESIPADARNFPKPK